MSTATTARRVAPQSGSYVVITPADVQRMNVLQRHRGHFSCQAHAVALEETLDVYAYRVLGILRALDPYYDGIRLSPADLTRRVGVMSPRRARSALADLVEQGYLTAEWLTGYATLYRLTSKAVLGDITPEEAEFLRAGEGPASAAEEAPDEPAEGGHDVPTPLRLVPGGSAPKERGVGTKRQGGRHDVPPPSAPGADPFSLLKKDPGKKQRTLRTDVRRATQATRGVETQPLLPGIAGPPPETARPAYAPRKRGKGEPPGPPPPGFERERALLDILEIETNEVTVRAMNGVIHEFEGKLKNNTTLEDQAWLLREYFASPGKQQRARRVVTFRNWLLKELAGPPPSAREMRAREQREVEKMSVRERQVWKKKQPCDECGMNPCASDCRVEHLRQAFLAKYGNLDGFE